MKIFSGLSIVAILIAASAAPSFADTLAAGGTDTSITTASANFTGAVILASANSQSFQDSIDHFYGGTSVITNYSGNPFGLNDLTFVYQMGVYPSVPGINSGHAESISMGSFAGYSVDVMEATNVGNTGATLASLDMTGQTVKFYYIANNELLPGDETYLLIVNTNATAFQPGTFTMQDDSTWTSMNSFAPATSPTPEPSTLSLLGTGLLAAGAGLRRRMVRK